MRGDRLKYGSPCRLCGRKTVSLVRVCDWCRAGVKANRTGTPYRSLPMDHSDMGDAVRRHREKAYAAWVADHPGRSIDYAEALAEYEAVHGPFDFQTASAEVEALNEARREAACEYAKRRAARQRQEKLRKEASHVGCVAQAS